MGFCTSCSLAWHHTSRRVYLDNKLHCAPRRAGARARRGHAHPRCVRCVASRAAPPTTPTLLRRPTRRVRTFATSSPGVRAPRAPSWRLGAAFGLWLRGFEVSAVSESRGDAAGPRAKRLNVYRAAEARSRPVLRRAPRACLPACLPVPTRAARAVLRWVGRIRRCRRLAALPARLLSAGKGGGTRGPLFSRRLRPGCTGPGSGALAAPGAHLWRGYAANPDELTLATERRRRGPRSRTLNQGGREGTPRSNRNRTPRRVCAGSACTQLTSCLSVPKARRDGEQVGPRGQRC